MAIRQTSIDTYNAIKIEGLLSRMRFQTYEVLFHHGPMSGAEVDEKLSGENRRGHYHKRLSELRDAGCAYEVGKRACKITGRETIIWDVTDTIPRHKSKNVTQTKITKVQATNILKEFDELLTQVVLPVSQELLLLRNWLRDRSGAMPAAKYVMVTGHRPNKLGGHASCPRHVKIQDVLREELRALKKACPELVAISGVALGVDQWFARVAFGLKIPVHAYVPCLSQDARWPRESRSMYHAVLHACDKIIMVSEESYTHACMQQRNEAMVDAADHCIAVWDGTNGGTANCVRYIQQQNKSLTRIHAITLARS